MKPYSKYKASGIEWIGDVPEHWDVMSIRRITDDHKQGYYSSDGYKTNGYKLVRITDLDENGNIDISNSPHVSPNEKELEIFQIKKGDILFPRTGSIGLVGIAKVNLYAVFASYLIRFRFNNQTEISFMRYFFISDVFLKGLLSDLHGGVNQNIHAENIKNQTIFLPPLPEQTQIANFLDRKTTELDTLIANKKSLIELLKEERTAIINHAITKGISGLNHDSLDLLDSKDYENQENQSNPKNHGSDNVRYKDSGIEWIGEIPEHWEVVLLKRIVAKIKDGTHGTFQRVNEGYPFLSAKNVYNDGIRISETESLICYEDFIEITKNGFPQKNDLLITCVGTIGRTYVYDLDISHAFQRSVSFIRFNKDINPQYYKYYVESSFYQNLLISLAKTSAQSGVYMGDLMNTTTLKLPISEQNEITNYLNIKTTEIDTIICQTEKEIDLLKEYKTALISEVVLGKVDVRE